MKFLFSLLSLVLLNSFCLAQKETKTFLLNKEEYKYLESNNLLISKAIENIFGIPNKQNYYKIEISKVTAWNTRITEFQYFPAVKDDSKKPLLKNTTLSSNENSNIKFKLILNHEKSVFNEAIKQYINEENNTLILNIVVVGDPRIFITEASDKTAFLNIIDEKSFTEKAFKNFFGENPKKMNYNIVFDNLQACLVKNIISGACNEQFDGSTYNKFSEKVTSAEYSASFILIDLHVIRQRSTLTPAIEAAIIKETDGTEHLKFYFCIPKDNIRGKKKTNITVEGKIISASKTPMKGLTVYLRDRANTVLASEVTDNSGSFKFDKLTAGSGYNLFIDNSCKESSLYLYNKKDVMIGQYQKTAGGFEYKLLEADIVKMSDMEETDPSLSFIPSVKGRMLSVTDKVNPIKDQVIELKNMGNQIVQLQKTDAQGNFEFKNIDPKLNYSIELPNYTAVSKTEKVYLANMKNELMKEFKRGANNKFSYKLIPADMQLLSEMNDEDVEMTFSKQKNNNAGEIIIQDFIHYDLNSFQLTAQSKPTLDKIAKIISDNAGYMLDIISHTDCRGETAENQKLSQKRSESVMNYFIAKNIDAKRLKSVGMGESKPLNSCVDGKACVEDEYKMNRRTEFRFYK